MDSSHQVAPMKRVFQSIRHFRADLNKSLTFSFINKVLDLMPPFLTAWLIDIVSGNPPNWIQGLGYNDRWSNAIFVIVLTVIVFLLESFFEWLYKKGFLELAQNIQHDLRLKCYSALQKKHLTYFSNQRTGNLLSILNDDINQLERFFNTSFNEVVQLVILLVIAGTSLCMHSLSLGLLGMLPIPFIIWGSIYYQKKVAPHYRNVREAVGSLSNRIENNISGIAVIKTFATEGFELDRVSKASHNYKEKNLAAIKWSAVYIPLIRILITIGFASTLLIGAYWVINDLNGFTYGTLAFYAMMIQRLLWPITSLGRIFDEYERARASSRRIFEIIDGNEQLEEGDTLLTRTHDGVEIKFDNVHFSYQDSQDILKDINLTVKPLETVGIVGTTGAGKTTLVSLLMRLYQTSKGEILINGIPIENLKLQSLRSQIAFVSQEVYLFHGTIKENITYGNEDINLEELNTIIGKTHLTEFIDMLPNGLDTVIGEKGVKLSGGQRQRVSLARAMVKNSSILILDEATSAVDTETEVALQENLKDLLSDKTAFIIAHRLGTVKHCDRIIVMEKGRIIEEGTHQELLATKENYYNLWNAQN